MRKMLFISTMLISFASLAQVKFMPGVRTGLNIARFTQNGDPNEVYNTRTGFYVAFLPTVNFTDLYTLQPEVGFSSQGAELQYIDAPSGQPSVTKTQSLRRDYFTIAIINKFKFQGFNVHLGPTIEIGFDDKGKSLNQTYSGNSKYGDGRANLFDMGITAGVGYNFTKNIGIEARIKKGIIPTYDSWDSTNLVYQMGLYYNFGK